MKPREMPDQFTKILVDRIKNRVQVRGLNEEKVQGVYNKLSLDGTKRPFDMKEALRQSEDKEIQNYVATWDQAKAYADTFIRNFKLPLSEDKTQRDVEVKKAVDFYKSIGIPLTNALIDEMKNERGNNDKPSNEEIEKLAVNSTRNFMFNLTPVDISDKDKDRAAFFNDLSTYFHEDGIPGNLFDKTFTKRLNDQVNDMFKIAPYLHMVEGNHFVNIVKENALIDKFEQATREKLLADPEKVKNEIQNLEVTLIEAKKVLEDARKDNANAIATTKDLRTQKIAELNELKLQMVKSNDPRIIELGKNIEELGIKLRALEPENKVTNIESDIANKKKELLQIEAAKEFDRLMLANPDVNVRKSIVNAMEGKLKISLNEQDPLISRIKEAGFTVEDVVGYANMANLIINPAMEKNNNFEIRSALTDAWLNTSDKIQKLLVKEPSYMQGRNYELYRKEHALTDDFRRLASFAKDVLAVEKNYEQRYFGIFAGKNAGTNSSTKIKEINNKLAELIKQHPDKSYRTIANEIEDYLGELRKKITKGSNLDGHIKKLLIKIGADRMKEEKGLQALPPLREPEAKKSFKEHFIEAIRKGPRIGH